MLVTPLTTADLPDCLALAQSRGWPAEDSKWRTLLNIGRGFGLRTETNELVGTTILSMYGSNLAVISMVLVAASHGRQGLGRQLMDHALDAAGDVPVFLYATDYGRPLYERLGFVSVGTTHMHLGEFPAVDAAPVSRPATPTDLPAVIALDTAVQGADRSVMWQHLPALFDHFRVLEREGVITGCAGAWPGVGLTIVGPIVADSPQDARALVIDIAATIDGPIRLDFDAGHADLAEPLHLAGTAEVMVRGLDALPGDRARWFSPAMQALG